ncbi:hypothetical protein H7U32_04535 [Bifidobacterium pullorum subsp. saeculare]|uniref:Uncharacterized protein n=1 Tax=Bifidobacterium pullorum subsp. saeculare TaxID=78257 RepID=A0A939BA77_9BIFI|nr:hypothetical protein [Bifidobacterium pullorum]MBM6699591.1 hypothetical protein [Bifidobacterium pullorum subsp. saeculare]
MTKKEATGNSAAAQSRSARLALWWRRLPALCAAFLRESCAQPAGFVLSLVLPSVVFVMNNFQYAGVAGVRTKGWTRGCLDWSPICVARSSVAGRSICISGMACR